jgi:two-component system, NtrC family, nitrogen regulation sensor histidine kinase NtrY
MKTQSGIRLKILYTGLICLLSLVAAIIIQFSSGTGKIHIFEKQKNIEEILRSKEKELQTVLDKILTRQFADSPFDSFHREFTENRLQDKGLSVFLYRNDSLIFWSNNNVPANTIYNDDIFSFPLIYYGNGWFRVMSGENENLKAVGLILIKNDFPYQNEYLINDFQKDFDLAGMTISTNPGKLNIHKEHGEFLFSLDQEPGEQRVNNSNLLVFGLLLISFISVIVLLYYLYSQLIFFQKNSILLLVAFCFDAILLRFLILYFEIPGFLYKSELFSPYYYATSFISPSLGDLVINSLLWLTLAWIFYDKFSFSPGHTGRRLKQVFSPLMIIFSGLLYFLLISTMKRLVIDSNVELNLNNIFNVDVYSGLGFLSMTCILFAFFLVSAKLSQIACQGGISKWIYTVMTGSAAVLMIPLFSDELAAGPGYIYPGLFFIYMMSFLYFSQIPGNFRNITGILFYIVVFSLISTFVLDYYHSIKERETRKILAAELSSKRDPLMEYEFAKISNQIINDSTLLKIMAERDKGPGDDGRILSYLQEKYFNNFWNKYEVLITICQNDEILNIQPGGYLFNCFEYFKTQLEARGTEEVIKGLFFLDNKMENIKYIAAINLPAAQNTPADSMKIFVELFYKYISQEGLGYPDLLIDKKVQMIEGIGDYSYARYYNDNLIYKNGDFLYHLGFQAYDKPGATQYFIDNEGYNHYIFRTGQDNKLIISKKNMSLLDLIAPFSYLFIFFSLFLIVFLAGYWISGGFHNLEFSFTNRLQLSIIAIIVVAFFILGIITRSNIIYLYNNKNRDNLSEKTFSVLTELEHKLGEAPVISDDLKDYISEILFKFSSIYYSDINLFDTRGTLIASSRPQIFEEELLSGKMNTEAYYKLSVEKTLLFIQNEKIGRQEYLSAYIPFRNNQDQIIAYLNLPYFAKQTELRKEIGDFLAAYINVYVLLIVLAIMVTIMVSRFITRPLQLIREKLGNIGLAKSNEKIEWDRKDEIGSLVEEYNRMIDELAKSAELLARSERESAWREMAKQVAHEIKNPLTPMKLSVQYLQKAWDEKTPDWEKQLKRFTHTIIEQIDSLSEIASEFSDFAKMPAANIEKIELTEIIKSATDLYQHHQIRISVSQKESLFLVRADKKQLLRAFNNLIQNAVQAIGDKENGMIDIKIIDEGTFYDVSISDNGTGITDDQAARIFSPSFTTKSSGMGLGLAMVKSILTTINGSISFVSKPGEGTTFYVKIPASRE